MCLRLLAARQLEAGDAGLPACCTRSLASGRIVFVDVPERGVVCGFHIQRGIVARAGVLVRYRRLKGLEVAIGEAPGRPLPIGQDVKEAASIRNPRLRQAVTGRRFDSWRLAADDAAREDGVERGDR